MRDLKPANVLIMETGYIKVADFGLASYLPANKLSSIYAGTLRYMPPEMCSNRSYGLEADWWSIGVLTYELLCGCTPFVLHRKDSKSDIVMRIREAKFEFKPDNIWNATLDPAKEFISALLCKNRLKRIGYCPTADRPHRFYMPPHAQANINFNNSTPASCYTVWKVREYRWFKSIDWNSLYNRTFQVPRSANSNYNRHIFQEEPDALINAGVEIEESSIEDKFVEY